MNYLFIYIISSTIVITNVWTPTVELGSGEKSFPFHDFRAVTVSPNLLCLSNAERSLRILHQNLGILHTSFPFLPFFLSPCSFFKLSLSFYHIDYQAFHCSGKKNYQIPYILVLSKSMKVQRLVQCNSSGIEILWKPQPKIVFPSVIYSSCYSFNNVISTVVTNPHHVSSMTPKMKNKK